MLIGIMRGGARGLVVGAGDRAPGAGPRPTQWVLSLAGSLAPRRPFASPGERGGSRVPAPHGGRQPVFQVLPCSRDAGHPAPGGPRCAGWTRPCSATTRPAECRAASPPGRTASRPGPGSCGRRDCPTQGPQRRQIGGQRDGLSQAGPPHRPGCAGRLRVEWRVYRCWQAVQDRHQFLAEPRMALALPVTSFSSRSPRRSRPTSRS